MEVREIEFPPKDAGLRADVSALGALVGDVIREQGGDELFQDVEAARKAAIRRREGEPGAEAELNRILCLRTPAGAEELVRSFSAYFQVVNLAEKVHRIRRRRDHLRDESEPQRGSLDDAIRTLRQAGRELDEVQALFSDLLVEPVFTAHPSQATRRTILEKQQRIARCLLDRLDSSMTPPENRASWERIRADVTSAWQTEEHPFERPTVSDELEHVLFYMTDVIYRIIPPFYEALEAALTRTYGAEAASVRIPPIVRFASWVGGDMDGNPNVTSDTIFASLGRQRQLILARHQQEVGLLARQLSQSLSRIGVDDEVLARIDRYTPQFTDAIAAIPTRHRGMPYRVLLQLMAARLDATARDAAEGYENAEAFVEDLRLIARSLEANRGSQAGAFLVSRALRRAETFGFHLATLDVRQDGRLHREVIGRMLGEPDWLSLSSEKRTTRVRRALESGEEPPSTVDEEAEETLAVFRTIAACRQRHGLHAIGPFIVSMTQGPDDLLSILLLARWSGLLDGDGNVPLDVTPLFETVTDLQAAQRVIASLLSDTGYAAHLAARGNRQLVMIGYSDSNKDGGFAASRWALQRAQAALVETTEAAGVKLTFFHGRGGTIGRGGGNTHRAVMAAPRGAVGGRLRVTEQGEMIDAKYGLRGIAMRTLERSVSSVALATAMPPQPKEHESRWRRMMDEIARVSREAYASLVYGEPRFVDYFRSATPIDVIELMAIGSRPPSRRRSQRIEDLRAIPWVFSWTQSRHLLPGWYGLGTGLEHAVREHGEEVVAEMLRDWAFLRTLIDDAEMVLAKADMPIAARYAELAEENGHELFERIRAEHALTVAMVTGLKGTTALLDEDPTLQRSIRLRNPYVDPMSLLQVDLLSRWRASRREDQDLFRALLATVNGIAQGLQNTG